MQRSVQAFVARNERDSIVMPVVPNTEETGGSDPGKLSLAALLNEKGAGKKA
jgi:hypothetical protein